MTRRGERNGIIVLVLAVAIFAVYLPTSLQNGFVDYDDPEYVTANDRVKTGLTVANIRWAFTTGHAANWHPLTWMSHMIDYQLFGPHAAGHHAMSVLMHAATAVLLYLLLEAMTRAAWPSALAAALFALHPTHVESVAWVAERKDVLSALLFMLTLWAYVGYTRRPSARARYVAVIVLLALGLMAKPMLVTVPFLLLLLDIWPLRRATFDPRQIARLVIEKVPLFLLSIGSCIATYLVQQHGGAVKTITGPSGGIAARLGEISVAYAMYVTKLVCPTRLAVFYPRPASLDSWLILVSLALLVAITVVAALAARRAPYLIVGWLWFVGMLVPVIGIVRVGDQMLADRYLYLPSIGLFIAFAWMLFDMSRRISSSSGHMMVAAACGVALIVFSALTIRQMEFWGNTQTLFTRALDVTTENWLAHSYVGTELAKQQRLDDATAHFAEAIRINPNFAEAHFNLGNLYLRAGRASAAEKCYAQAVRIRPSFAEAEYGWGTALATQDRHAEAIEHFEAALRSKPIFPPAQSAIEKSRARMDAASDLTR